MSYAKAAIAIKKSKDLFRRWVKCFKETKTVDNQPGQGVWRKTSKEIKPSFSYSDDAPLSH